MTKSPTKNILGISAYYHDAAAALLRDGEIVAAAQEERFTRKKHDASFPRHAIEYCLEESGLSIANLDSIVFYDKPLVKFERLLETYLSYAPNGFRFFCRRDAHLAQRKAFSEKHAQARTLGPGRLQNNGASSAVVCRASPVPCRISFFLQPLR